jgi:PIN domain nuclease of toxin-antitoxin system
MGRHEVILLDTHVALWLATNDNSAGTVSRALAADALAADQLAVSAISFWEIALLIARGRFESPKSANQLRLELGETRVIELPLTGAIAVLAVQLENLHGDPADRFIAATAIAHGATLMTADRALLRWRNPLKRQDASK